MKWRFATAVLLLAWATVAEAGLDRNRNFLNDAWELLYGTLPLHQDPDGDGFTNAQESDAGTNPFDPNSHPPRLALTLGPELNAHLTWDSVPSKRYVVRSRPAMEAGAWTANGTNFATGFQSSLTLERSNSGAEFFQLVVDDLDSDQDGLTDWEEQVLGFQPLAMRSERRDETDLQMATAALDAANVVTVSVLDPRMSERWGEPGLVAVRRSGGLNPLQIHFSLGGSATAGIDYHATAESTITLPASAREAWIEFHPVADSEEEPAESITINLQAGEGYVIGANSSATLMIENENEASGPSEKGAARFLIQAAFGPDQDSPNDADDIPENVEEVMELRFEGWLEEQFKRSPAYHETWYRWNFPAGNPTSFKTSIWMTRALGSSFRPPAEKDQLPDPFRQRVAFALSEILVVSDRGLEFTRDSGLLVSYYDLLIKHAFGNYEDLLMDVALHPAMGLFLSHIHNTKADPIKKTFPDENFAREVMQLFTIGVWKLNPDGTRVLDSEGRPIPSFGNADVTELARVFTGFDHANKTNFNMVSGFATNPPPPMACWDEFHDREAKTLLSGLQLPAREASPGKEGLAGMADVRAAISNLFVHPNVGPFVGRLLIQRFVTSNPSPGYVGRVAAAFADNGDGVRGDMKAVLRAIFLDDEARDWAQMNEPTSGKLREPFLRLVNLARAFNASSESGYYAIDSTFTAHGQQPLNAASVFNFFLADYSPQGALSASGLVAPEFQIVHAGTAVSAANYFWEAISGVLGPSTVSTKVKKSDLPLVLPNSGNFYSVSSAEPPMGFMS